VRPSSRPVAALQVVVVAGRHHALLVPEHRQRDQTQRSFPVSRVAHQLAESQLTRLPPGLEGGSLLLGEVESKEARSSGPAPLDEPLDQPGRPLLALPGYLGEKPHEHRVRQPGDHLMGDHLGGSKPEVDTHLPEQ